VRPGDAGVAVVGIGTARQTDPPCRSADDLAAEAAERALADAGLGKAQLDGLVTCKSVEGTGADVAVGRLLGISPPYSQTLDYGSCNFSLHLAAMAIGAGMASTIVLTYGTTARSTKMNFGVAAGNGDLEAQSGLVHIAGPAALAFRRHMHLYGTTEEQLGMIAVSQRRWARSNPDAAFREPLSLDEYLAMPYLVEPLRRADVTMRSDGGAALVVTRADRAADAPRTPVHLLGMAEQSALREQLDLDNVMRPWLADVGRRIWATTGLGPQDVDLLYVQDPTSVWVLQMLEHFGFCPVGSGGPYLAEGHTLPGGDLPVNTNGGQLSESYMWGWLHLCEAVRQLRGEAGERQVADARVALYGSTQGFAKGAASLLAVTT
jgi:acetyl-CoA acetyltransferase